MESSCGVPVMATYSPQAGSYASQPAPEPNSNAKGKRNEPGQVTISAPNGERLLEAALDCLTEGGASCVSNWLLAAALLTSVLNTLLLSFVVKTIQLSDRGFAEGSLTWDEQLLSSKLDLPARLAPDKSIFLNSIESAGDKALRLQLLEQPDLGQPPARFLATGRPGEKANQLAATGEGALELGAKRLVLRHFGEERPLLELRRGALELPLERQLRLASPSSNSLLLDGELNSPELSGSLEEKLDVQTRDGSINCESAGAAKLVSRSASVKLTSGDQLELSAPTLEFRAPAGHLYLASGVRYLDAPLTQWPGATTKPTTAAPASGQLRAYNLVAVNGLLMAAG